VVVEIDLDVAAGNDPVAFTVVDQLIALKIERLAFVHPLHRPEQGILAFAKGAGGFGLLERVGKSVDGRSDDLRILRKRGSGNTKRKAGHERKTRDARQQMAGRSTSPGATTFRCLRSTHHV